MTYTFSCPAPCRRVIRVEARDDEDAVWKIINAGAMTCRNKRSDGPCDSTHPALMIFQTASSSSRASTRITRLQGAGHEKV